MKRLIDLTIKDSAEHLIQLLNKMKAEDNSDFEYNEGLSNGMALSSFVPIECVACFVAKTKQLFHSKVYILINIDEEKDTNSYLWISNIVPSDVDDLEKDGYNKVVKAFTSQIITKHISRDKILLSEEEVQLSDIISKKTYERLETWERTSDHNSPFSHPLDRNKWMAFICSAFINEDDVKLNAGILEDWLREDKEWGIYLNNIINKVLIKYTDDIELLHYYKINYNGNS
ncbi:hypothetical protein [Prevotella nigrescens]|uniref:hypothetical protein n=1 Tax=Prevotella nigrescens TaxID=28133 RepID=UPI0036161870